MVVFNYNPSEILQITGEGYHLDGQHELFSFESKFSISNFGKLPGRISSVRIYLYAPIKLSFGANGPVLDSDPEHVEEGFGKANDGGAADYELANLTVEPGGEVRTKYNHSALKIVKNLPSKPDRIGFTTKYLWLIVDYSDPNDRNREAAAMIELPFLGRAQLMHDPGFTYDNKAP